MTSTSEPAARVECDSDGVPFYKWPPFPQPPPGVTIIPFKDFKPKGIQIRIDGEEVVELDGEGIPTTALAVTHNNEGLMAKKSKKKTKVHGEELIRRNVWWEDWAEGEDLRSSHRYDTSLSRVDRFIRASQDFKSGRQWPPISTGLTALYDQFRLYIGLIGNPTRPSRKLMQERLEDEEDEELSDEDVIGAPTQLGGSKVAMEEVVERQPKMPVIDEQSEIESRFQNRIEAELEAKDARMDAFLNDPELSIKIFLSSYFRDKGMLWSNVKLRDGPIIVAFFLKFLTRNRALPESQRALLKATDVAERAKIELPQTKKIALALPDEVGEACTALWGSKLRKLEWPTRPLPEDDIKVPDSEQTSKKAKMANETQFGAQLIAADVNMDLSRGIEEVEVDVDVNGLPWKHAATTANPTAVPPESQAWGETGGWGATPNEPSDENAGWGTTGGWGAPSADFVDDGGGWGAAALAGDENGEANPWAAGTTEGGWEQPLRSLMALLGPTTLPLTHTTGIVEESTRQIVSWSVHTPGKLSYLPGDSDGRFATVVLAPWPSWSTNEGAGISPPEIIESGPGVVAGRDGKNVERTVPPHNPKKDNINLLVDKKVADVLCRGMGIGATWVQVVPRLDENAEEPGKSLRGKGKGGGRVRDGGDQGGGKGGESGTGQTWWYIEKLYQVMPSYWTDISVSAEAL